MFFTRHKTNLLEPEQVLPGRETPHPRPGSPRRARDAARSPRSPTASRPPSSAWAASGAPSGSSGRPPGVYTTAVGYAGGHHAEPDLRGGVLRPHRPHRGRARRRSTRAQIAYEAMLQALLGEPRPDPGHAPGQRRRHPVPLGDLRHDAERSSRRPRRRARPTRRELGDAGLRRDHHRDRRRPATFYYAEDYHQQYLAKNPNGYCGLGGTGVSCPIGITAA